jgi:hypothetical protein
MFTRHSIPAALFLSLTIGFWALPPQPGAAQIRLDEPDATISEDFGAIQTVRELPDGRVLVADPLGKALYVVDFGEDTRTVIGREGQGPDEYRQPDAVWPLPGDSTLLVDLGNGRLVALASDLSFGPTMPISLGDFQPGRPLSLAIPQGVDAMGRIYARSMGGGMGGAYPDSASVLRVDRATKTPETAATFKIQAVTRQTSGGANNQNVMISPIPLSPEDAWGIAADGSVVVARSIDYHIERIAPDGTVTRGPPNAFEAVAIRTPEKEEYLAERGRAGGGIAIGVEMTNGQMSMTFGRGGDESGPREIDQYTWPEAKPPFYGGRIPVDPMNRAWVRRHVDAGEPSTYDVFDESGSKVGTVLLDNGKRVVGFGEGAVFVVGFDEFDLNYLQRYVMPGF